MLELEEAVLSPTSQGGHRPTGHYFNRHEYTAICLSIFLLAFQPFIYIFWLMSFLLFVFVGLCVIFLILDPWVTHTQDLAAPEPQMSFNLFSWGQVTILLGQTSFISTCSRNLSGLSRQDQDLWSQWGRWMPPSSFSWATSLECCSKVVKQFLTSRSVSRIVQRVPRVLDSGTPVANFFCSLYVSVWDFGLTCCPQPLYPKHDQVYF